MTKDSKRHFHCHPRPHLKKKSKFQSSTRLVHDVLSRTALSPPQVIQIDHFKVPFFHLYETIYKFRHSIINLLEQNKFGSLAGRLDMIQQLSSVGPSGTNDYVDNSERVLKDTVKVLQTCLATLMSSMQENDMKQKSTIIEPAKSIASPPFDRAEQQQVMLEQKDRLIHEINAKYEQVTHSLEETSKKHQEEST